MPNPARRSLKSDFFEIFLLSMTKENLQSISLKNVEESSWQLTSFCVCKSE